MKRILNKYSFIFLVLFVSKIGFAQQPTLMLPIGHTETVKTIDICPSGKYILSSSLDNSVLVWNSYTGKSIRQFYLQDNMILSIKFIDDNAFVVLYSGGKLVKFDLQSGKQQYEIQCNNSPNEIILNGKDLILYYKNVFLGLGNLLAGNEAKNNEIEIRKANNGILIKTIEGRFLVEHDMQNNEFATINIKNEIMIYDKKNYGLINSIVNIKSKIEHLKTYGKTYFVANIDGSVLKISSKGIQKQLFIQKESPKQLLFDHLTNMIFSINGNEIIAINSENNEEKYIISFKSNIEDIFFYEETPNLIYFFFR